MAVHFIGVRHHSPACARVVADAIDRLEPKWVLIEGPADMNARIDELLLDHELPIAIYSYLHGEGVHHGSWAPFCEYSPEWQALTLGTAAGAQVRFIDLPAWHWALHDRTNRYSDNEERYRQATAVLCERFRVDGLDSLWDHLFEQPCDVTTLAERLAQYFDEVRAHDDQAGALDSEREQYMAQWVSAATAEAGDANVVVVTGGFHTAAIRSLSENNPGQRWPGVPEAEGATRLGSFLVPFTFKRLDSFVGYQSGMPSPAWYELAWAAGPKDAAELMLGVIVAALRAQQQPVSAADLIAAQSMAHGLARLRGHEAVLRSDLLDGLAAALLKDAQDVPLPWTRRGNLQAGTDPMIVEIARTMSGERRGRLHSDTPAPPLVADAFEQLSRPRLAADTEADSAREVELDLLGAEDLSASRVLHRLRVLAIPGIDLTRSSSPAGEIDLVEVWSIAHPDTQLPALIEAGAYGATLESASAARVAEGLAIANGDAEMLAQVLSQAVLIGISTLTSDVLDTVRSAVRTTADIRPLGLLLQTAVALFRYDTVLETAGTETLAGVVGAAYERALWLVETVAGDDDPARVTRAVVAMRDALRCEIEPALPVDVGIEVMRRVSVNTAASFELRGAAFGWVWSVTGQALEAAEARQQTERAFAQANRADVLGDWLTGVFALARDEVVHDDLGGHRGASLIELIDGAITAMSDDEFLGALPSLRMAFAWFPPSEREQLAERVLQRHGIVVAGRALPRLPVEPEEVARGHALDSRVDALLERFGLVRDESDE